MSVVDDLHRAREAYERPEWVAAYRALSDLDDTHLRADDFAALATTAFLLGHRNDCVQALQRAYQAELKEIGRALRPAARLVLLVWQERDRNEWATAIRQASPPHHPHRAARPRSHSPTRPSRNAY